jgi:hypothetical protein
MTRVITEISMPTAKLFFRVRMHHATRFLLANLTWSITFDRRKHEPCCPTCILYYRLLSLTQLSFRHTDEQFICSVCKKEFKSPRGVDEHFRSHWNPKSRNFREEWHATNDHYLESDFQPQQNVVFGSPPPYTNNG